MTIDLGCTRLMPVCRSACTAALRIAVAASVALCLAIPAAAGTTTRANLGLKSTGQTCDGKSTYSYAASWRSTPNASFWYTTGNGCHAGAATCGTSSEACSVRCSRTGECRIEVRQCVVGKGAPWGRVTATDRSIYDQMTVSPPGKCV